LGWVYFKQGNLGEAENYLNAAWRLTRLAVVADHLGQVYERGNKKADAIRMYKFAINHTSEKRAADPDKILPRLVRLVPGAKKSDCERKEITEALVQMNTVKIAHKTTTVASAEFFVMLGRNAKTDVKFISGAEDLRAAADALRGTDYPVLWPGDEDARVVRRGVLGCSPISGCTLAMVDPDSVRSVK
jgi:hypothetical protein